MGRHTQTTAGSGKHTWESVQRALLNQSENPKPPTKPEETAWRPYQGHTNLDSTAERQYQGTQIVIHSEPRQSWFVIYPWWMIILFTPFWMAYQLIKVTLFLAWMILKGIGKAIRGFFKLAERFWKSERVPFWVKVTVTVVVSLLFVCFFIGIVSQPAPPQH